ncbi:MAG: FlgD immunoglobulin-like domain containing protein [Myxococcota bacterium]|nr:FlgD immunoglobulin-like domain containing protein [Myxococcota bacterium]
MNVLESGAATRQAAAGTGGARAQSNRMGKDEFLKLLTTQMQAQDPLNPMDNTEFVAQLSQFTSLERLENMSQSIEAMAMSTSANTSAQMVSFIGKNIDARSDQVRLDAEGNASPTRIDLHGDAYDVQVTITDSEGRVVRTIELGEQEAGDVDVVWDGLEDDGSPLPEGEYTVSVKAEDAEGESVSSQVYTSRRVAGVSFQGGFPRLELEGDVDISLGDVNRVHED